MFNEFAKKIAEHNTALPSLSNGDERALQVDSSGRLIVVTSGAAIDVAPEAGSEFEVVQPTHDDLNLNANIQIGDADVGAGNPVPISDNGGSITVDGTVDVGNFPAVQSIDDNGGSITVDNAGTFAVQVDGDALTALQLIDDIVLAEDDAHISGESGILGLAVRQDTPGTLVDTDGDRAPLQVDADGNLRVTGDFDASVDDVFESGTEADAASDDAGDGIIAISGASMTDLATIAVGAGVTLYITGLDFSADDQARFELIVDDNGTPSEWIRAGALDGLGDINKTFPRAIEISGAADRSVILRAQKLSSGSANAAGAINGYTR